MLDSTGLVLWDYISKKINGLLSFHWNLPCSNDYDYRGTYERLCADPQWDTRFVYLPIWSDYNPIQCYPYDVFVSDYDVYEPMLILISELNVIVTCFLLFLLADDICLKFGILLDAL